MEKQCNRCGKTLPVSSFHKDMSQKDNLMRACKECLKISRSKRRIKENAWARRMEAKNRDEMNDQFFKKAVKWHRQNYRYNITVEKIRNMLKRQSGRCFYCKVILTGQNIHIEHYYPKKNTRIVLACADCNRLKWSKDGDEFIVFLKEYISRFL